MRYVIMHNGVEYTPMKGDVEYNFVVGEDNEVSLNKTTEVHIECDSVNIYVNMSKVKYGTGLFAVTYASGVARHRSNIRNYYSHGKHEPLFWFRASDGDLITIPIDSIKTPYNLFKSALHLAKRSNFKPWKTFNFNITVKQYTDDGLILSGNILRLVLPIVTNSNSIRISKQIK